MWHYTLGARSIMHAIIIPTKIGVKNAIERLKIRSFKERFSFLRKSIGNKHMLRMQYYFTIYDSLKSSIALKKASRFANGVFGGISHPDEMIKLGKRLVLTSKSKAAE